MKITCANNGQGRKPEVRLDSLLESMTPEEKMGSFERVLKVPSWTGIPKSPEGTQDWRSILFGRNIESAERAAALTGALKGLKTGPGA